MSRYSPTSLRTWARTSSMNNTPSPHAPVFGPAAGAWAGDIARIMLHACDTLHDAMGLMARLRT